MGLAKIFSLHTKTISLAKVIKTFQCSVANIFQGCLIIKYIIISVYTQYIISCLQFITYFEVFTKCW